MINGIIKSIEFVTL